MAGDTAGMAGEASLVQKAEIFTGRPLQPLLPLFML